MIVCSGKFTDINTFSTEEKELLLWRSGANIENTEVRVCEQHRLKFLTKFSGHQKKCSDPYNRDPRRNMKTDLKIVSLEQEVTYRVQNINMIPATELCSGCRKFKKDVENSSSASQDETEVAECGESSETGSTSSEVISSVVKGKYDVNRSDRKVESTYMQTYIFNCMYCNTVLFLDVQPILFS